MDFAELAARAKERKSKGKLLEAAELPTAVDALALELKRVSARLDAVIAAQPEEQRPPEDPEIAAAKAEEKAKLEAAIAEAQAKLAELS